MGAERRDMFIRIFKVVIMMMGIMIMSMIMIMIMNMITMINMMMIMRRRKIIALPCSMSRVLLWSRTKIGVWWGLLAMSGIFSGTHYPCHLEVGLRVAWGLFDKDIYIFIHIHIHIGIDTEGTLLSDIGIYISQVPSNVHILPWLPQFDILSHPNLKLFITHGGLLR